ncbi:hypothetical protein DIPPA_23327 [Diplonema papillatum]|nr:hypothetical protein DIPPA_23327 [Diplonema papillatum]
MLAKENPCLPASKAESWGEMLSGYSRDRAAKPPPTEPIFRFTRKMGVVQAKEAAFNPITQRHVKAEEEATARDREQRREVTDVNKGMLQALTKRGGAGYDIINQRPKFNVSGLENFNASSTSQHKGKRSLGVRPPDTNTEYDIVTLQGVTPEAPKAHRRVAPMRQYDIVAHQYASSHADRIKQQREAALTRSEGQLKTRYNPVRARFNDAELEAKLSKQRADLEDTKRLELHNTTHKTPVPVRRSEGHNYDIVVGHVWSPSETQHIDKLNRVGVAPRSAMRAQVDARNRRRDDEQTHHEQKALNRISHKRAMDRNRTGFDIINGSAVLPPINSASATCWDIVSGAGIQR